MTTRQTVKEQRHLQEQQDQKDKNGVGQNEPVTHDKSHPGSDYPTPPLPQQHLEKAWV